MRLEFYIDPETGEPHIYKHAVAEGEVEEILTKPALEFRSREGSKVAIGQTSNGRYLKVVFREVGSNTKFVITAYTPNRGAMRAFRRHMNKKQK